MEHPPPLPTTSLEDLPPPYLDYLDAAALCRLGYGTTKKQHFGVTSAAVRCATERDAVPLGATAPPGARDALELLRRRERAVCWEPFGARSQFLRRRWRRGPTTPDDVRATATTTTSRRGPGATASSGRRPRGSCSTAAAR